MRRTKWAESADHDLRQRDIRLKRQAGVERPSLSPALALTAPQYDTGVYFDNFQ